MSALRFYVTLPGERAAEVIAHDKGEAVELVRARFGMKWIRLYSEYEYMKDMTTFGWPMTETLYSSDMRIRRNRNDVSARNNPDVPAEFSEREPTVFLRGNRQGKLPAHHSEAPSS